MNGYGFAYFRWRSKVFYGIHDETKRRRRTFALPLLRVIHYRVIDHNTFAALQERKP